MFVKRKILHPFISLATFFTVFLISNTSVFAQAVTLTPLSDMDMGIAGKSAGAVGNLTMNTNGSLICDAGFTCPSTGVVGSLQATGPAGSRFRVRCVGNSKRLRNSVGTDGSLNQDADEIYIRIGSGTELLCLQGAWTFDGTVSANPAENVIYVGMRFVASDARLNGQYSMSAHPRGELGIRIRIGSTRITQTIDGLIIFEGILGIIGAVSMDFGSIQVTGTPTAGDRVELGTNSTMSSFGNFAAQTTGTAGEATISGVATGDTVEVYCSQTATLAGPGSSAINVTGLEVDTEDALSPYGGGASCNGSGSAAMSFIHIPGTRDQVYLGGVLNGGTASGTIEGNYSTSNPGGSFIDVTFVKL
ncbi:MAG: hypothetical protein EP349_00990 [Alphaproteobacteria bacterium]|nr:MAG: hypothetical protein EP349_00990 [Alphaproteobacteria bacterium]